MLAIVFLLLQTPATPSIQGQIALLQAERDQLLALQRDCAPGPRSDARASLQAVIDKLTALKADAQATDDIDAIFDSIIVRLQDRLRDFDEVTPGRPCTVALGAGARLGEITSQIAKLRALENR